MKIFPSLHFSVYLIKKESLLGIKESINETIYDNNIDKSDVINEEYWENYHSNEYKNIFIPCINCNDLVHFPDCGKINY